MLGLVLVDVVSQHGQKQKLHSDFIPENDSCHVAPSKNHKDGMHKYEK